MSGTGALKEVDAEKTILLVDDEENILRALVRLLRRDGYTILTASSANQGLELLKTHPVGVILSDQRMPEVSGVDFLSQVKQLYPDTIRVVLSGYTELNTITDAINHGAIYKFLTKPWEDDLLRENISEAFNHFRLANENQRLNKELQRLNEVLEKRVIEQNRESKIESKILKITQQVMDQQPVGVLGVSDVHTIVMANDKAHELLSAPSAGLITLDAMQVLPDKIMTCFETLLNNDTKEIAQCEHKDNRIIIKKMNSTTGSSGVVITIIPMTIEQ